MNNVKGTYYRLPNREFNFVRARSLQFLLHSVLVLKLFITLFKGRDWDSLANQVHFQLC